jgi:hypothetical protein
MDDTLPDESRTSTPSSFGSPLGYSELSLPGARSHLQLSRAPSFTSTGDYQWSVPQNQHTQSDTGSYPGSPLSHSGPLVLPHERLRSVSSLSHRSNDRQTDDWQVRYEQVVHQNALLEKEVQSIK